MNWNDVKSRLSSGAYSEIFERAIVGRRPWIFESDAQFQDWRKGLDSLTKKAVVEVKIVGSAATGFTLSPLKEPGRPFRKISSWNDETSDIDLALIGNRLFEQGWDAILDIDRASSLGGSESAKRTRLNIYNGFAAFKALPRGSSAAQWILGIQSLLARTPPLRGYPLRFRVYRRMADLRAYHVWSLKKLHAKLSGEPR